jgi:hypothetical protein
MEITETEAEAIGDGLRLAGFDTQDLDNDQIALIAQIVVDAIDPENK